MSALPLLFLIEGCHLAFLPAAAIAMVQVLVWGVVNHCVVLRMERNAPRPGGHQGGPPSLPVLRSVLAGVVALAVGLAAPFWWFDGAVEGLRTATERETAGRRHALLGEDGGCRAVLDRPAPTIDADPELVALRRTLDDARNELSAVRSGLLCELDGTCGTKQDGAGSIYRAKRELSDQLQKRVEVELPEKIASRTSAVHGQIESDKQEKVGAGIRHAEIDQELAALPGKPTRLTALNRVVQPRWTEALGVVLAAIVLYLIADLLILRFGVRRICSVRPRRASVTESTNRRSNAEER